MKAYETNAVWEGPIDTGFGPLGSGPSAASHPNGEQDVFWQGNDGNLWEAWFYNGSWFGPANLGMGPLGSPPSAAASVNGLDEVVWMGTGSAADLYEATYDGSWHGPLLVPHMGPLGSPPSAADLNGHVGVFWQGTDHNLWQTVWNGSSWSARKRLGFGPMG